MSVLCCNGDCTYMIYIYYICIQRHTNKYHHRHWHSPLKLRPWSRATCIPPASHIITKIISCYYYGRVIIIIYVTYRRGLLYRVIHGVFPFPRWYIEYIITISVYSMLAYDMMDVALASVVSVLQNNMCDIVNFNIFGYFILQRCKMYNMTNTSYKFQFIHFDFFRFIHSCFYTFYLYLFMLFLAAFCCLSVLRSLTRHVSIWKSLSGTDTIRMQLSGAGTN